MSNNQVAKFVNSKEKQGITKVLALKGLFGGEDRSRGKLENSLLHRFVLEGHFVQRLDDDGRPLADEDIIKKSFAGNLPVGYLPALVSKAERAMLDKTFNGGTGGKANMLLPEWKPMMKEIDDKGNPRTYALEVTYMGNLSLPIQVKLSNAHAPVLDTGKKMNLSLSQTYGKEELVLYISADEWYNELVNCRDNWLIYRNRIASLGHYDDAFLL